MITERYGTDKPGLHVVFKHVGGCVLALAVVLLLGHASMLSAADETGDAAANVAVPISVSQNGGGLNFGAIQASIVAGTVTVTTSSTRSVTGGVTELGGTVSAATFDVAGDGTSSYSITLPLDNIVSLTGPGTAMLLTGFNHDAGVSPALSGGTDSFNVGAILAVGVNQSTGSYTGNYTVTVGYD